MRLLVALCLLLGSIALSAQSSKAVRYSCPGGETFSVEYKKGRKPRALIYMEGKPRLELPIAISASGARYSDGYTTLWEKGGEALLEAGSINVSGCRSGGAVASSSQPGALLKGEWNLSELNGRAISASSPPTLAFLDEDKRVAGFAGCNRYNAGFEHNGASFQFKQAVSTKMACMGDGMSLESEFLKTFESVTTVASSSSELAFKDSSGKVLLKFRPK
jgi:heat shock protein HslJ